MAPDSPIVRVEFEYADGAIQRLSGPPAEEWLKGVNNNIISNAVRYSEAGISDYPWEWTTKSAGFRESDPFEDYSGLD